MRDFQERAPTKAEVADAMVRQTQEVARATALRVAVEVTGPIAKLFEEFMARQAALEDATLVIRATGWRARLANWLFGATPFVYVPKPAEPMATNEAVP